MPNRFMPPSSSRSDSDDLLAAVRQTLISHSMVARGDRVLVGVSGGPDSMTLLHLLHRLAPQLKISLGVAHLNHCLRGAAADQDAEMVRKAAEALNLRSHLGRARVLKVKRKLGLSPEEAARRVRYAFLHRIMLDAGYTKLALGHHQDDNAEQVLLALLRGTGPTGLSGILPVRKDRIIRPLIQTRRSQIEAFISREGVVCVVDATNSDLKLMRNRVRHRLLPLLASEYQPRIVDGLNRLADVIRSEQAWIEEMVAAEYQRAVDRDEADTLTLPVEFLGRAHPALARRLVRRALQELSGSLRRIRFSHVQSLLHLLSDGGGAKELHLPGGIRVHRTGDRLTLLKAPRVGRKPPDPAVEEEDPGVTVIPTSFPATIEIMTLGIGMRLVTCRPDQLPPWADIGRNEAYFDLARLCLPLVLRPVAAGDRFTPLGAGGSQKVKKYLIDHRIPRRIRTTIPVLADQQRIIWLVGQRMDDHPKVTAITRRVLRVDFFLLDTR